MANPEKWHKFKPLPADIHRRLARLDGLFATEGVHLAYLFGSLTADGPAQDVDLALLLPPDKRPFHLHPTISSFLGIERLDLVDLRRASPALQFEIIKNGRCLFASDNEQQLLFETAVIRTYQDTVYWRHEQEKMLKARMQAWS